MLFWPHIRKSFLLSGENIPSDLEESAAVSQKGNPCLPDITHYTQLSGLLFSFVVITF